MNREGASMNLPDAPIAEEGFYATYFFTVSDQERSKDFYVRILGESDQDGKSLLYQAG